MFTNSQSEFFPEELNVEPDYYGQDVMYEALNEFINPEPARVPSHHSSFTSHGPEYRGFNKTNSSKYNGLYKPNHWHTRRNGFDDDSMERSSYAQSNHDETPETPHDYNANPSNILEQYYRDQQERSTLAIGVGRNYNDPRACVTYPTTLGNYDYSFNNTSVSSFAKNPSMDSSTTNDEYSHTKGGYAHTKGDYAHTNDDYFNPNHHNDLSFYHNPYDNVSHWNDSLDVSERSYELMEKECTLSPGTIILYDIDLRTRKVGSMDINPKAYQDPKAVHDSVTKTICQEWNKNQTTRPTLLNTRKRKLGHGILQWKPLSVFSAYTNIKVSDPDMLENIPTSSCFGKINMRMRRAWVRGPNKKPKQCKNNGIIPDNFQILTL